MGRYLDIIRQVEEAHKHEPVMPEAMPAPELQEIRKESTSVSALVPGSIVTWLGRDATPRGPGTVDFIHTDTEGTVWAFVSLPEGTWVALNGKYLRVM